jgi:glycosyltransferase involved in cell wall biosynthesis
VRLVSLIMPVWNPHPDWLADAVTSALEQRDCAVELIVVDDGSDEPVADLLAKASDSRLTVLRTEHRGASSARNAGLAVARGTLVRFVDSDDVITERSTAHLLELMGDDEDVITYGSTVVCDASLRPLATTATDVQGSAVVPCLLNRFAVSIHSLLFPRSVIDAAGPWEPSLTVSEDWDFVLRTLEHAHVRGDREVATFYRTHEEMSSRDLAAGIHGYRRVVERFFERHPEQRGSALERKATAEWNLFAAEHLLTRCREYSAGVGHLQRALPVRPGRTLALGLRLVASLAAGRLWSVARARAARA